MFVDHGGNIKTLRSRALEIGDCGQEFSGHQGDYQDTTANLLSFSVLCKVRLKDPDDSFLII